MLDDWKKPKVKIFSDDNTVSVYYGTKLYCGIKLNCFADHLIMLKVFLHRLEMQAFNVDFYEAPNFVISVGRYQQLEIIDKKKRRHVVPTVNVNKIIYVEEFEELLVRIYTYMFNEYLERLGYGRNN